MTLKLDPHVRREWLNSLRKISNFLESTEVQRSCGSCEHWDGRCRLAGAVPPSEVQAEGCEAWVLTQAPF